MHSKDLFDAFAMESGVAFIDPIEKTECTYQEVFQMCRQAAQFFVDNGLQPREKVICYLSNSLDYAILLLALLKSDLAFIPLNPHSNKEKLNFFIHHSQATMLITSDEILGKNSWVKTVDCKVVRVSDILQYAEKKEDVAQKRDVRHPGDVAKVLLYTSGTTGDPKGVVLTESVLVQKIIDLRTRLSFAKGKGFFSFLPLYSGHGMIPAFFVPFFSGCTIYVGSLTPFFAVRVWALIKEFGIQYFSSVPSVLMLLKKYAQNLAPDDVASVEHVFCASAPLPQSVYDWYNETLGLQVQNCYGLTETAAWICISAKEGKYKGSQCVGKPLAATFRIVDDMGRDVPVATPGEILVQTEHCMSGYFENEAASREVWREGYLKTGDVGYLDDEGDLFLLSRKKHIIIRNGITIYPIEVDQMLLTIPEVVEAVTFGVPDDQYGERVISALVPSNMEVSRDHLLRCAHDTLPQYLWPNEVLCVPLLPKGPTGKVIIDELIEQYKNKDR